MAEAQNEKWKQVFYSQWFLLVLFLLAIFLVFSYIRAYYQESRVRSEIDTLHEEVETLEAKKIKTVEILKYVQSQAFIEEKARTELNLLKPGEKMAIIPSGSMKADIGQPKQDLLKWSSVKNSIKWFKFFFFKDNN